MDLMIKTTKCQSHEDAASSQGSTGMFNGGTATARDIPTGSYATNSCSQSSNGGTWVKEKKLEMEAMEATLETLGEKCSKLEVEAALLKLKVERLESDKKRVEEVNEYLEQQKEKLENDVEKMGSDAEKMRSYAEKMRSDAKKMRSDLHQSQLKCVETDGLMRLQSRNEEMIRRDLQYEIKKLEKENAQLKQRLASS